MNFLCWTLLYFLTHCFSVIQNGREIAVVSGLEEMLSVLADIEKNMHYTRA